MLYSSLLFPCYFGFQTAPPPNNMKLIMFGCALICILQKNSHVHCFVLYLSISLSHCCLFFLFILCKVRSCCKTQIDKLRSLPEVSPPPNSLYNLLLCSISLTVILCWCTSVQGMPFAACMMYAFSAFSLAKFNIVKIERKIILLLEGEILQLKVLWRIIVSDFLEVMLMLGDWYWRILE